MDQEEKFLLEFYEPALTPFLGRRKHFVLEWPSEHNAKVFHKAFHCQKPQRQEGKVEKPRSSPNFCLQVERLMGSMRVWKKRVWESKNLEKNRKNQKKQKKQFCMDLPKILLTELFFLVFLVFFEFLDKWAWESKKPREKPKKTKKTILHGLTQDSSHRIVFFVFFVFFWFSSSFWTSGLGRAKIPEKNKKNKKKQFCMDWPKILLTGLFWKAGNGKKGKKQNMQKPNAPSVCFWINNIKKYIYWEEQL